MYFIINEISPLNSVFRPNMKNFFTQKHSHKVLDPIVTKENTIFFFTFEENKYFIHAFQLDYKKLNSCLLQLDSIKVIGCASYHDRLCFIIKHYQDTFVRHSLVIIDNDSIFNTRQIHLPNLPILSFQAYNNNIYITLYDENSKSSLRTFTYDIDKKNLKEKNITYNLFFLRFARPFIAYCKNGIWHFYAISDYYRKNDFYYRVSSDKKNIMSFRSNLTFHLEDQLIDSRYFDKECIDFSTIGVFNTFKECNYFYLFNNETLQFELFKYQFANKGQLNKTFVIKNLLPSVLYTSYINDTLFTTEGYFYRVNYNNKMLYFHSNSGEAFSKSYSNADFVLVPIDKGYIFFLRDGQYCCLNEKFERTDNFSCMLKLKHFATWQYESLKKFPVNYASWSIAIIILGYPLMYLVAFIVYLIKIIFFSQHTKKFSLRRKKKVLFAPYLLTFLLLWFVASIVAMFYFFDIMASY